MNTKTLFLLFLISLLTGCSKEPLNKIPGNEISDNNFWTGWEKSLNLKDFDEGSLVLKSDENGNTWIFGLKNSRPWLGLFNGATKEKLNEWNLLQNLSINTITSPIIMPGGYAFVAWERPESDFTRKTKFYILQIKGNNVNMVYETTNYSVPHIQNAGGYTYIYWDDSESGLFPNATPSDFSDTYLITDKNIIENVTVTDLNKDTTIVSAFRNDKMWIGLYLSENDKWQNFVGKETIERNIKVAIGEEIQNVKIDKFQIESQFETPWGKGFTPVYIDKKGNKYYRDIMIFDTDNFHYWYSRNIANSKKMTCRDWYQGSILLDDSVVISPKGESIVKLKKYKSIGSLVGYDIAPISPQDSIKQTNSILISYTEAISFRSVLSPGVGYFPLNWFIERYDYKKGESIWCISWENLNEIPIHAKVEGSVDTSSNPWIYNIKAERKEYIFSIDIEMGTLTPTSINNISN
ncbi:hypothetical protein [Parabacteroides timonensis]|uniref:hypothetical protein n=1 Tax=Parabacteroides timonensis TaxID=1871013 RepID=UPI00094F373F|nr:hypothetical protein [Parabacteroides timonensis]